MSELNPTVTRNISIVLIVCSLVAVLAFGAYYVQNRNTLNGGAVPVSPLPTPMTSEVVCTMETQQCSDGSFVGRTGPNCEFAPCPGAVNPSSSPTVELQKYEDPQGRFRFNHPMDYTLVAEQSGQSVRLTKAGPTQKAQTEMYDGAVLVFEPMTIRGQTLEQWIDAHIQETTTDGTVEIIEPKRALTLNGKAGFTYTSRGLGTFQNYFFRYNEQSPMVLSITTLVNDPTNAGFQAEIDRIMASVEILK